MKDKTEAELQSLLRNSATICAAALELLRRRDEALADVPRSLQEAREGGIRWAVWYCTTMEVMGDSLVAEGPEGEARIVRIGMGVAG